MIDVLDELAGLPGGPELLRAAARTDAPAYLVGGAVRDILLGRIPRELDVAVEGDAAPLLAALSATAERHERFGTAVVRGDGWTIDIARCRAERYPRPGALPEVEPAAIETDLRRRDATINAVAVGLDGTTVVAADHAWEDLAGGRLRVLHEDSFRDDPTRLWRLARYRARLGFGLVPHTAALAADAVRGGALETVSGQRVGNELRLALGEPAPAAALGSVHALGLAPWLDPDAGRIAAALALAPADARGDLVVLGAVLRDGEMLNALSFQAVERDTVLRALDVREGRRSPTGDRASQIAAAYRGLPAEAVALAPSADRALAARWLSELRDVGLAIDGDDLIGAGIAPGPDLGARLRRTLDAVLDGELPADRDAQLHAALA